MPSVTESASYRVIYKTLQKQAVKAGSCGQSIPSYRALAKQFSVGESTVIRAINLLKQEGWAYGQQGKATYLRRPPTTVKVSQIALITPALDGETRLYAKGLSKVFDEQNHQFALAVYSTHGDLSRYQQLIETVILQRPQGLILTGVPEELCQINTGPLMDTGIPIVLIGCPPAELHFDCALHTGEDSGKQIAKYLLQKKYRDLAFLSVHSRRTAEGMLDTLRRELTPAGIELREDRILVFDAPHGFSSHANPYVDVQQQMTRVLAGGFHCETLICSHDYPAVAALRAALAAKIAIPRQMKIISGLRCAVDGASPMKLTTVDSYRDEQAEKAAKLLIRRINGYDGPTEVHYLAGGLIEGETG